MMSDVVTLSDGGTTARIAVAHGFNCFEFRAEVDGRAVDVLYADPTFHETGEKPSWNGIPLLFPFPNRIRGGRYSWQGRDYEIPASRAAFDGSGNAIHGFCLDRPWRVLEQNANSVLGVFQLSVDAPDRLDLWPTDFEIRVRYLVSGSALKSEITIINPGTDALPWGFGTHSYFQLPLSADSQVDDCLAIAPAGEEWELVDCLPTGKKRPVNPGADLRDGQRIGDLKLDDVLSGLSYTDGFLETTVMDEHAGLQVTQRCDTAFRELVAFTPPWCDAVCLEPYTCVTDAINLEQQDVDAGWRVLEAGEQVRLKIEIQADKILV